MPSIGIKLDADQNRFDLLKDVSNADVIHVTEEIEVGTLRRGMESGKDSVAIAVPVRGQVVLIETSAELFIATARAIEAWQAGRRDRGED